jgi:hypothetical protein
LADESHNVYHVEYVKKHLSGRIKNYFKNNILHNIVDGKHNKNRV